MNDEQVERELTEYRTRLAALADAIVKGGRDGLYPRARDDAHALTCLLDEAPEARLPEISYLLDRYEALMRRLAN